MRTIGSKEDLENAALGTVIRDYKGVVWLRQELKYTYQNWSGTHGGISSHSAIKLPVDVLWEPPA